MFKKSPNDKRHISSLATKELLLNSSTSCGQRRSQHVMCKSGPHVGKAYILVLRNFAASTCLLLICRLFEHASIVKFIKTGKQHFCIETGRQSHTNLNKASIIVTRRLIPLHFSFDTIKIY